jgi:hypothetical protein
MRSLRVEIHDSKVLIQEDSNWFEIIERENLDNLLE